MFRICSRNYIQVAGISMIELSNSLSSLLIKRLLAVHFNLKLTPQVNNLTVLKISQEKQYMKGYTIITKNINRKRSISNR